jgi:hypothetical protein
MLGRICEELSMSRSNSIGRVGAALLGLCVAGSALAAERPDFTGVWGNYRAPGAAPPQRGAAQAPLPLRPEAKAKVDAYHALVDPRGETPGGYCLGTGMPGSMLGSGGYPMEIVQHENIILVVYEAHAEIRRIYLGEPANPEDLFPDRNGYSFGRWDGDKLIVETTHLKEAVDQQRYPHSDQAKIVEEYHLETRDDGSKVLVANMTLEDPAFYTETIKAEKKWLAQPGVRLLPYECNEPTWDSHLETLRQQQAAQ